MMDRPVKIYLIMSDSEGITGWSQDEDFAECVCSAGEEVVTMCEVDRENVPSSRQLCNLLFALTEVYGNLEEPTNKFIRAMYEDIYALREVE